MSAWAGRVATHYFTAALAAQIALSGAALPVFAQDQQDQQQRQPELQPQQQPQPQLPQQPQPPPPQQALTQQQVQQLVAPIALYPDALLAQVLTASTYPLEVTMAARWSEKNPNLKDAALEDAMQKQQWDPSVKGLTSVPQVLAMMNEKLDWTNQLGEAFLTQPNDIQNAVQALRKQAEATGSLKSSKEQKVSRIAAPPSTGYAGPPEYVVNRNQSNRTISMFRSMIRWLSTVPIIGRRHMCRSSGIHAGGQSGLHSVSVRRSSSTLRCGTTTIGDTQATQRSRPTLLFTVDLTEPTLRVAANFKTGGSTPLITATYGSETQTFSSNSVMWAHEEARAFKPAGAFKGFKRARAPKASRV